MPKNKIKIASRYRDDKPRFLEFIEQKEDKILYKLSDCNYVRIILDGSKERNIMAVDPPGGPFMSVGDTDIVKGTVLDKIEDVSRGLILTFKLVDILSNDQ